MSKNLGRNFSKRAIFESTVFYDHHFYKDEFNNFKKILCLNASYKCRRLEEDSQTCIAAQSKVQRAASARNNERSRSWTSLLLCNINFDRANNIFILS